MEAPQGVELTGTNGGKAIILHHPGSGWWPVLRPSDGSPRQGASGMRHKTFFASIVRFPDRHGPIPPGSFRGRSTRFAAAMARVRRPVPFRTRKLRPCTAMVLHPRGCGRVARRRSTRYGSPRSSPFGLPGGSSFFPPRTRGRAGRRSPDPADAGPSLPHIFIFIHPFGHPSVPSPPSSLPSPYSFVSAGPRPDRRTGGIRIR